MEVVDSMPLLEWFANHYKDFGATLEIITDRSQEGAQFVRGFGGIGGTQSTHNCPSPLELRHVSYMKSWDLKSKI